MAKPRNSSTPVIGLLGVSAADMGVVDARVQGIKDSVTGGKLVPVNFNSNGLTTSFESISVDDQRALELSEENISRELSSIYALPKHSRETQTLTQEQIAINQITDISALIGLDPNTGLTQAQVRSGVIAAAASAGATKYMTSALDLSVSPVTASANKNHTVVAMGMESLAPGYITEDSVLSAEAFDDRENRAHIPFNIAFNVQAARQNDFGEAFYPTTVITPDQAGFEISIARTIVYREVRHNTNGNQTEWHRRHLLDAAIDSTVLQSNVTKVIPQFVIGNTVNNAKFVASAVAAPTETLANGAVIQTAPLRIDTRLNLLGLGTNPVLTQGGALNSTDTLDNQINVSNIYLRVTDVASGDVSTLKYATLNLPRSQFQKSQEGMDREMNLNFTVRTLPARGTTKDLSGVAAEGLAYLTVGARANWLIELGTSLTGTVNTEYGDLNVDATRVHIERVYELDADGRKTGELTDATALAALRAAITLEVVGYDVQAYYTNLNRRQRGYLLTDELYSERWAVPLLEPITAPKPVTDTRTNVNITSPVTAARLLNSINAVTKLLTYSNELSTHVDSVSLNIPTADVEGIGRRVIKPFHRARTIDMVDHVQGTRSADRADDVSRALTNILRTDVFEMYRATGYEIALEAETGTIGGRPTVLIGTDPVIARHLIVTGDTRLIGLGFDYKIVTTLDGRMKGRMFTTFVLPNANGPSPLSFGLMAWIPELATTLQITREGATTNETTVQPRARHINTCPILLDYTIQNLEAVVSDRIEFPVVNRVLP